MSFDGISTRALCLELQELIGAKINRVNQPNQHDLVLNLYKGKDFKLYITAASSPARIYLIEKAPENPKQPGNFCMVLRKHIQAGRILSVEQYKLDRLIKIEIEAYDEFSSKTTKYLYVEMMGKHANIILVDSDNKKIIDSIKKVSFETSNVKQVLPGMDYEILDDGKINILEDYKKPSELVDINSNKGLARVFYSSYTGFSPLISKEILFKSNLDVNIRQSDLTEKDLIILDNKFTELVEIIRKGEFQPIIGYDPKNKEPIYFYSLDIKYLGGENKAFSSYCQVLYTYFTSKFSDDRLKQRTQSINNTLNQKLKRLKNKYLAQYKDLEEAKEREKLKIWADLLSANLHKYIPGSKSIEVENFYTETMELTLIPLDVQKNGPQNAQSFYKKYSKLKNTEKILSKSLPQLKEEIDYLDQILYDLENIDEVEELNDIENELIANSYLKNKINKKKRQKPTKESQPLKFKTSRDKTIYVGKNNRQNDELTLKTANKNDIFLHVQESPGSHVILRNDGNLEEADILEAASLASKYSSLKKERYVTVDYTKRKNVYKAKGAKPGMVYYTDFNSVIIDNFKD